ncbi:hypothetical protein N8I74_06390 [Chitiniphilus purpureus]|uniref:Restriction endonuclease n=1 Tax=Chitiniphilus purpureus TaxID=2981137 RepID=A0ABY6DQJ1_9NEIS|nr:hypothetical protein [Chitiniphilus sp. CD1]UXY16644.1 hypothetical protein N8I74_06390 [Chitiniphilus sp. CD1]
MTKLTQDERFIQEVFKYFGFELNRLDGEANPDFLTDDGQYQILLELKTKEENPERAEERAAELEEKEVVLEVVPLSRNNRIAKLSQKAANQLRLKKSTHAADFCFVVLQASGRSEAEHMEQFEASVYGSTHLITFDMPEESLKKCYYFHNSDFFNGRDILDGAILIGEGRARFCINDLSPRYELVRDSAFVRAFSEGVIDPVAKEADGKAYSVRTDVDRNDEEAVLAHLREKYGLDKVMGFNFAMHSAIAKVKDFSAYPNISGG